MREAPHPNNLLQSVSDGITERLHCFESTVHQFIEQIHQFGEMLSKSVFGKDFEF